MQMTPAPRFRTRQVLRLRAVLWVALFVVSSVAIPAQTPSTLPHRTQQGEAMKHFVLIFRQGTRVLSEEEQKQRAEEIKAWAAHAIAEGWKPEPHSLAKESYRVAPEGESAQAQANGEGSIIAILFIEARDFNDAVTIAKGHPGTRYGSSIEVRGWTAPTLGLPQTPVR
jgi:hypothetical protein